MVVRALDQWFDRPVDVLVSVGVAPRDYPVGEEVLNSLSDSFGLSLEEMRQDDFFEENRLNLPEIIYWQTEQSRRSIRSLKKVPFSTGDEEFVPFLSYRRDETDDRMVNWIFQLGQ